MSDEWYDLPRAVAGIRLYELREELRKKNLYDTEEPPLQHATTPLTGDAWNVRTSDGMYNDLACPRMGRLSRSAVTKAKISCAGTPTAVR